MRFEIKSLLEKNGKSVYWLAKKTNMKFGSVKDIMDNKTKQIRFDTLEKLCLALECTPNDIIVFDEKK